MTPYKKRALTFLIILLILAQIVYIISETPLHHYFSLKYIKEHRLIFEAYYHTHPLTVMTVFFLCYVLIAALSIPGAGIMTIFAGSLFGLITGIIIVSFASSIGAALAFLITRHFLGDYIQKKYGTKLKDLNTKIQIEGKFYLFALRLIPEFPFFLVNILMSLTKIPIWSFYWVSQLGMLPVTILFVNAGTRLGKIHSAKDIMSIGIILSLIALGLFPIIVKWFINYLRKKGLITHLFHKSN